MSETGRERLNAPQLWDRDVREGDKLVVETMGDASVEMSTGLTRTIHFFLHDSIEIMLTTLCDATEIDWDSIIAFRTAMHHAVDYLYDKGASACDFYNVYVEEKLVENWTISWHEIRMPNKPRVHFILKDSVTSSSTVVTESVDANHGTQNSGPAIKRRINSAGNTAALVHLAVGNELVAEGSAVVSAQTASTRGPGVPLVNRHTCLVPSQKSDRHKHLFPKMARLQQEDS